MRHPLDDPDVCSGCGFPVGACECSTLRDDGSVPEYVPEPVDAIEDDLAGRYTTPAIESGVLDDDREVVGHVGLFDLDDVPRDVSLAVAERLPGVSAVLRSSPGSFHVWSLSVRSLDEWLDVADRIGVVDDEHIALSERRDCQVLRIGPKVALDDGREVAPEPALVGVLESETDLAQSRPHARMLRDRWEVAIDVDERDDLVGETADERVYMADIGGR